MFLVALAIRGYSAFFSRVVESVRGCLTIRNLLYSLFLAGVFVVELLFACVAVVCLLEWFVCRTSCGCRLLVGRHENKPQTTRHQCVDANIPWFP